MLNNNLTRLLYRAKRKANSLTAQKKTRHFIVKYRVLITVLLLSAVIFMPAYTSSVQVSKDYLTRYDLALAVESILDSSKILIQPKTLPMYKDLTSDKTFAIYRVLSCSLMQGFSDGQFKPEKALRNLEVYCYLQRLSSFLSQNNIHSHASRQLLRLMSYKTKDEALFAAVNENNSLRKKPFELAEKKDMLETLLCITGNLGSKETALSGRVISSVSLKPIKNACVVCGKNAVITGENGQFKALCSPKKEVVEIFAAAEGYKPLELKKSLDFGKTITLRLNPS